MNPVFRLWQAVSISYFGKLQLFFHSLQWPTPQMSVFFYSPDLSSISIIYSPYRFDFEVMLSVQSSSTSHSVLVTVP